MHRSLVRIAALILALIAVAALARPSPAVAHAAFVQSDPAPDAVVQAAPERVTVWFTEPLSPRLSGMSVIDTDGASVVAGAAEVDGADPTRLSVPLRRDLHGTYTVSWSNVSTVDGHALRGSFSFHVGAPTAQGGTTAEIPLLQSPSEPAIRWLVLLAMLAMVGGVAFDLLVLMPALRSSPGEAPARDLYERLHARARRAVLVAALLFAVASLAHLVTQAASSGAAPWEMLSLTWGRLWTGRLAFGALLAVVVWWLPRLEPAARPALHAVALVPGGAILAAQSLVSHGAATAGIEWPAVANDLLHLTATAFWAGGLIHLALAAPLLIAARPLERGALLSRVVARFSPVALLSAGVLVVTGIYSAYAQVTALRGIATPYGAALLVKGGLVAGLLALAAVNLLVVARRLLRDQRAAGWLRRVVLAEAGIAVVVVLVTGVLTSLEPARQTASRQAAGELKTQTTVVDGVRVGLTADPSALGTNTLVIRMEDPLGQPITNATLVVVKTTYYRRDLGSNSFVALPRDDGAYVVNGALLTVAGPYLVEIAVTRPDGFDLRPGAFLIQAAGTAAAGSALIAPDATVGLLLFAGELVILGLFFAAVAVAGRKRWAPMPGAVPRFAGAMLFVGVVLVAQHLAGLAQSRLPTENPFTPTPAVLAEGQRLYEMNCLACHGAEGRGDGPGGAEMVPPPADLTYHAGLHPDSDLFRFVHDGFGIGMPAWGDRLTDEEIWYIVTYVEQLTALAARDGAPPTAA
ncbi:MAG: c-type cytochrome, partial [SAR202 cluster bacterium]|nr:c-type cytochrome [SAR202 cluster bacterium]